MITFLAILSLIGIFTLSDFSAESTGVVILSISLVVLIPTIFLFISLMFMMNTIEITETSIKRKRFGKITKEVSFDKVIECKSFSANHNFKNNIANLEKLSMFNTWCYISDEKINFKSIEELRLNKNVICFKLTPKTKKIFMDNCPREEINKALFENII